MIHLPEVGGSPERGVFFRGLRQVDIIDFTHRHDSHERVDYPNRLRLSRNLKACILYREPAFRRVGIIPIYTLR